MVVCAWRSRVEIEECKWIGGDKRYVGGVEWTCEMEGRMDSNRDGISGSERFGWSQVLLFAELEFKMCSLLDRTACTRT